MTTATMTDAATVTLAFPLAAAEGLRHAITLAIHERPTSERDMLASIYGALVNPQPAPTVRAACAPVDVLATYDRLIREVPMGLGHMQNIVAAHAAVAELIEALRKAEDRLGVLIESDNEDHGGAAPEDVAAWEACNAALARVGSAGGAP